MRVAKRLLLSALALSAATATPADALTFNLINLGGTEEGTVARRGFEIAAFYWSSVLTNDVTVNLNIGFSALAPNVLGSTGSTTAIQFNSAYYGALASNATSSADALAVANLRPLAATPTFGVNGLSGRVNDFNAAGNGYVDTATRIDSDGTQNNATVSANTSVLKALGVTTNANGQAINYAAADGTVRFSSEFAFDFDPSNGIDGNSFDFIGVAIHEIGHALGFRSGVDTYDAYTSPGNGTATSTRTNALETATFLTPLDYFRYGQAGELDWSTQGTPYFSLDGGTTQVFGDSRMSTGVRNGDGRQASHFKDSPAGAPQLGNLDPTSARGQRQEVTALDLTAFDVIGWRTAFDPLTQADYRLNTTEIEYQYRVTTLGVPEPGTWATMVLGAGLIGGAIRRRPRAKAVAA